MDATGPDSAAPHDDLQEDLQAALAEIDKVSTESSTALATPGDGLEEPGDAPAPDNPPSLSPESVESAPAEAAETLTADTDPTDAAEPTDDEPTTPVESPDEMAAAAQEEDERPAEAPIADGETPSHDEPAPPSEQMPLEADEPSAPVAELEPVSAEQPAAVAAPEEDNELANVTLPDGEVPTADSNNSPDSKSGLVDNQLSALFSDAEQDVGTTKSAPPEANLDANDAPGPPAESEPSDAEAPTPSEQPPDDKTEPIEPPAQDRKLRFKIGRKAAKQKAAAPPPPAPPRKRREVDPAIQPATPWGKRLFRVADEALDKVNRPFERMQERTKALVGCAALTTLIVSALAMVAMPLILPHRDATMFLQEKRAALDAPPPSQESGEDGTPTPQDE